MTSPSLGVGISVSTTLRSWEGLVKTAKFPFGRSGILGFGARLGRRGDAETNRGSADSNNGIRNRVPICQPVRRGDAECHPSKR